MDAILGLDPDAPRQQADAFLDRPADESPVQALRAVARAQAVEMAEDMELWPLRLKVIDAHPALLGNLAAAFGEAEKVLAGAIAERTGTRVGVDVHPTLLAGVAGVADADLPAPLAGQRLHRLAPPPRRRGVGRTRRRAARPAVPLTVADTVVRHP